MPILSVHNLSKIFVSRKHFFAHKKQFHAVKKISFDVEEGEILGLLGTNGAGKTTTIQMLLGLLTPTSGSIRYFGKDFAQHRSEILEKVTFASTYVKLPGRLSVWENLDIFARLNGVPSAVRKERIAQFLKTFDMWNMRDKETGTLSAGQMTRVMLAKAFIPQPAIVLLDEPTASLDPDIAQEVRQFVLQQKREHGLSALFTSHNMDEVTEVCDRVLVMKDGTIVANNTPSELAASVSNAHVHLVITHGLDAAVTYAQKNQLPHKVHERSIELEIDEQEIAQFLMSLAQSGVTYSQIFIDKPTLEDFFLSVVQKKNGFHHKDLV